MSPFSVKGFKRRGSTTIETGPQYIYFFGNFVFSRENDISSVLSVLLCYITYNAHTIQFNGLINTDICYITYNAHTIQINGIQNKTHNRSSH